MTHEVRTDFTPKGRSPQRVIQRPRIPDPIWSRALAKAHRIERPIGHVIAELLEEWLEEPDRTGPTGPADADRPTTDRTEVDR